MPCECSACGDVHPLGERTNVGATTVCPNCGAKPYVSHARDEQTITDGRTRLREILTEVDGLGATSIERVCERYDTPRVVADTDVQSLTDIPYVGEQKAEAILTATQEATDE